jgi:hypothetical protein
VGDAAGPAEEPAPAAWSPAALDRDIELVVGGSFAADHIGPGHHAEVVTRIRTDAAAYLARFDALFLQGDAPDPARLALHLPRLLELSAEGDAGAAGAMALRLRRAYPLAMQMTSDPDLRARLQQRLLTLDVLLARLDTEPGEFSRVAEPDRVCTARDDEGRSVLRVERDCSCGERLVCRSAVQDGTLALEVRLDDSRMICDDCYQTIAICLLPPLPASTALAVTLDGRSLGTLAIDEASALEPGSCLEVAPPAP